MSKVESDSLELSLSYGVNAAFDLVFANPGTWQKTVSVSMKTLC